MLDQLTSISLVSLLRYFTTLGQLGYKSYSDVDKMLILLFLQEMLQYEFVNFITEDDYRILTKALYCITGNCMIPLPTYTVFDNIRSIWKSESTIRISEDSITRKTDVSVRIKE